MHGWTKMAYFSIKRSTLTVKPTCHKLNEGVKKCFSTAVPSLFSFFKKITESKTKCAAVSSVQTIVEIFKINGTKTGSSCIYKMCCVGLHQMLYFYACSTLLINYVSWPVHVHICASTSLLAIIHAWISCYNIRLLAMLIELCLCIIYNTMQTQPLATPHIALRYLIAINISTHPLIIHESAIDTHAQVRWLAAK